MTVETPHVSRVLVVEDDPAQRRTLCDIMREEGLEPVGCASGAEALECAANEDFAVAVVDQRLPDLAGTEVLERLRSMIGPARVIIHTAYGSFESARDAVNLGAFAYIEKAGDPRRLMYEVHRAIDEVASEAVWELDGSLRSLTEHAPDLIMQLDRDGILTFLNRNLAGVSVEDLLGTSFFERVGVEHRSAMMEAVRAVFETGGAQECEIWTAAADGIRRWYDCRVGPVVSRNRIIRAVVIARDISEKKQAEQIDRVVADLLRNARDAVGRTGSVSIETTRVVLDEEYVGRNPEARTGPHVMISVSDTGRGMSQEALERIFEPFYTTKYDGMSEGLGLASVYAIVAGAGGHIVVESDPGEGTTFRVYLPEVRSSVSDPFGKSRRGKKQSNLRLVDGPGLD